MSKFKSYSLPERVRRAHFSLHRTKTAHYLCECYKVTMMEDAMASTFPAFLCAVITSTHAVSLRNLNKFYNTLL